MHKSPLAGRLPPGPRAERLDDSALFAAVISRDGLGRGWRKVLANNGAAGGDNITTAMFARDAGGWIGRLARSLRSGEYRPGRLRHVDIPKRSGGVRTLSIPCVSDRVVQSSVALALMPHFDAEFEPSSFAYRSGRSVAQAVAKVSAAQRQGFNWIVDADIENFFGSVRHDVLMARWSESVTDGPLSELVSLWLTYAAPDGIGLPQGSPLSPLLANLFLDRLDEAMDGHPHYKFVRFADDFVILTKSHATARKAMEQTQEWLSAAGLRLNTDKTRILSFDKGLRFLGHLFVRSLVTKSINDESKDDHDVLNFMRRIARADDSLELDRLAVEQHDESVRKAGYSPGFRILYIFEPGRRLHYRNKSFTVEEAVDPIDSGAELEWHELIAINHNRIDRIDIGPKATLSLAARDLALATQTPIAYVDGHGQTKGWTAMELTPRAARHMAQAGCALDPARRLNLAVRIVDGRVRSQRAVLRRLMRSRSDIKPAMEGVNTLNAIIGWGDRSRIRQAKNIDTLMGFEGQAAAAWWKAIWALMPPDMRSTKRARRPDFIDPANAVLNFLSWLLHRDIAIAVSRAGLHSGFGILHTAQDRTDACVYDVMEGFRAHLIGGLAVYCFNKRIVTPSDFLTRPNGMAISNTAQSALIRAYEKRVSRTIKSPQTNKKINWRQLMLEQALELAAHIEGGKPFISYEMAY